MIKKLSLAVQSPQPKIESNFFQTPLKQIRKQQNKLLLQLKPVGYKNLQVLTPSRYELPSRFRSLSPRRHFEAGLFLNELAKKDSVVRHQARVKKHSSLPALKKRPQHVSSLITIKSKKLLPQLREVPVMHSQETGMSKRPSVASINTVETQSHQVFQIPVGKYSPEYRRQLVRHPQIFAHISTNAVQQPGRFKPSLLSEKLSLQHEVMNCYKQFDDYIPVVRQF